MLAFIYYLIINCARIFKDKTRQICCGPCQKIKGLTKPTRITLKTQTHFSKHTHAFSFMTVWSIDHLSKTIWDLLFDKKRQQLFHLSRQPLSSMATTFKRSRRIKKLLSLSFSLSAPPSCIATSRREIREEKKSQADPHPFFFSLSFLTLHPSRRFSSRKIFFYIV